MTAVHLNLNKTKIHQQAAFTQPHSDKDDVTQASFAVTELEAKKLWHDSDGEFMKQNKSFVTEYAGVFAKLLRAFGERSHSIQTEHNIYLTF